MSLGPKLVAGFLGLTFLGGELSAQTCSKFDVASIKVNNGGAGGRNPELTSGGRRVVAEGEYLMALLMLAYDVSPMQVSGVPSVFLEKRYDIEATCEEPMTKEQLPHLLRSLIEERFHLSVHREVKEQPVYALIVGKGGPRLHETTHESEKPGFRQDGHSFTFTNATIENLLVVLSQVAGRKVLDKTGLSGHYDFTLGYSPDRGTVPGDGSDSLPESVFTALREQLGLNLEPQRSPIEFIVVDHIEPLRPN
jgi:uncharacterized protein (TIGR03435 family)